jgi:hypothetical protein
MLRLMRDGERPRAPDCGYGRRAAPHHVVRVELTPRASPAGARHVFKQLLLDRRAQIREELIFYG